MAVKASAFVTVSKIIDIADYKTYYKKVAAGSAAPAKPTTFPPDSSWSSGEPAYEVGSSNVLYETTVVVYSDGRFDYATPYISSTYAASTTAYNLADNANGLADVANRVSTENQNQIARLEQNKVDSSFNNESNRNGTISWDNGALKIGGSDSKNYYETEIGGDGIKFKYGSNAIDALTVASINQEKLEINKTAVISGMEVGKWEWAIHESTGNLQVRWIGGE